MKTLRRLVAVGLLIGSYHVGMAQSNSIPTFKSEAEKAAWIKAHPELNQKQEVKRQNPNVRSNERFANEAEKQAWIKANSTELKQFNSIEEKRAWIKANPAEYEAMKANQKPTTAKATHSTVKAERFASDAEKQAWTEANPEAYREMTGEKLQWNSLEEYRAWVHSHPAEHKAMLEESRKLEIAPRVTKVVPTAERFSSEAEKAAWIKANPKEYKQLNSGSNNK